MVNHYFDSEPTPGRTRCGEFAGETALYISSNGRVSCPDCRARLSPAEREGQWYPFEEWRP